MQHIALITGASAGLGTDFARQLSKRGYHCILTARREAALQALQQEIQISGGTADYYLVDLADSNACAQFVSKITATYPQIDVLINNAGFGAFGLFTDIELTKQLDMVDVNCKSLLSLAYTIGAHMLEMKTSGFILNVASTAAFQSGPLMATYFATKAFVLSWSEAIRFEWKDSDIHVATLCPGPTKTEFFDRSDVAHDAQMVQNLMRSDEVVQYGLEGLFNKKSVIIPGFMNKLLTFFAGLLPNDLVMHIVYKMMAK